MVVTDPTIDPVTNLPVLNPQDVIQQIPLGVQTFPYEDLQATSRPTRGPLANEDILPTSAFLVGQNPSTGSAQTVETDGSHAAKVFVVNEAGGGESWAYTTGHQEDGNFSRSPLPWTFISPSPTKIFTFCGHAFADDIVTTGGGVNGVYTVGFGPASGALTYPLFTGIFSFDPTYPQYIYPNLHWSLTFPGGLPVPADLIADDSFTVFVVSPTFSGKMTFSLLYV